MQLTNHTAAAEMPVKTVRGALKILMDVINGPAHERSLYVYMAIVLFHWVEHLVQAYQIFVLGWPRPESGGFLGLWFPWLVQTELLHWGYAVVMLIGLILLRPGFAGLSRKFWTVSLLIQAWHLVEHSLLQGQAIVGQNLFESPVPTSIVQLWVPRPELHLIYNAIVFIPMVIAMYYHMYPPLSEAPVACTCSRRAPRPA
jgi:hypothetical protein